MSFQIYEIVFLHNMTAHKELSVTTNKQHTGCERTGGFKMSIHAQLFSEVGILTSNIGQNQIDLHGLGSLSEFIHIPCVKKLCKIVFVRTLSNFLPSLIIFYSKIAKRLELSEM